MLRLRKICRIQTKYEFLLQIIVTKNGFGCPFFSVKF